MDYVSSIPNAQIDAKVNAKTDGVVHEEDTQPSPRANEAVVRTMRTAGLETSNKLGWVPGVASSDTFARRCRELAVVFKHIFAQGDAALTRVPDSGDLRWLRDNEQQLSSALRNVTTDLAPLANLPHVAAGDDVVPRVLAIAEAFFTETGNTFSEKKFAEFVVAFEEKSPLEFREIEPLVPALELVLLERIAANARSLIANTGKEVSTSSCGTVATCIRSLREVLQTQWKDVLEPLVTFDKTLRQDPAGAYVAMDPESRTLYQEKVATIAQRSDRTEVEVAEEALALARQARTEKSADPRIGLRKSHIGYYLLGEGTRLLCQRVGCHPTFAERVRKLLRRHPDEYLIFGIVALTLAITTTAVTLLTPATTSLWLVLLSILILLLPSSQAAVQVMNYLTTNLLPATALPKLDFSDRIPDDCVTLVAIPTLLLNEKQVHTLVENLEVRFLGNHDPNLYFALVSDLPDSDRPAPEHNSLVELCSKLIADLNERYSAENGSPFLLLHRHRVYNPREKGWIGWERKRGKLLDLNQLLRGQFDSFPVKVGDLSVLSTVRYVITLDSDTELPRGSAHRMVGTIAHPLNQAIVDPVKNIVVSGYGILQPRVDVSVQSTSRSRLAAIFAGETGTDPYTQATSDVYQDLYGEGSFVGKGIYEVDTLVSVLSRRFPRNSLLSHDLIEGAYARAGLATDIIVIEDYPSHYSAYNRRKHRWLRGDWQIVDWLSDWVPDESGARVRNPISLISRWKILDNLRRSLVEPATFALLLFGWFVMGHPVLWTLATICLLFVPAWVELSFGLIRSIASRQSRIARDAFSTLFAANFTVLLSLTLLAHQMLLSIDAVVRALVRHLVTRERLLEWETAAESELSEPKDRRTPVDRYIEWLPILATCLGLLLWAVRPQSLPAAIPILALWASSQLVVRWLNGSPIEQAPEIVASDVSFLRKSALYIWRYFAEFSTQEHNWLVPDNIQDDPRKVAARISPTNVGLLLNARQVAAELGYLTLPEMVELTGKTLDTIDRLVKYRGHLVNWYDTRTLEPLPPLTVSSVDSGNLVASLWTLKEGCLDRLRQPLLSAALAEGLLDHLRILADSQAFPKRALSRCVEEFQSQNWLTAVLNLSEEIMSQVKSNGDSVPGSDTAWFRQQAQLRIEKLRDTVSSFMPWLLPEFAPLRQKIGDQLDQNDEPLLQQLPDFISEIDARLANTPRSVLNGNGALAEKLRSLLPAARQNARRLIADLRHVSERADELADAMHFGFLLDKKRLQMTVAFDTHSEEIQPYCYDLLATEPRTAVFIAIAKGDIAQECWFRLSRPYSSASGIPVLLSWTGTMFEYLMPSIWMRSYPNTLLDRAAAAAVKVQMAYGSSKGLPWGISESACSKKNDGGDYQYEAFGVPGLALKKTESDPMVVSPYSTFLALSVEPQAALRNLDRMFALGWFGSYGFVEAADYSDSRSNFGRSRYELVKTWMVHHQGMSLLSLANFLCNNVVQRWFHSDRRVQATELLLQEKSVAHFEAA